MMDLMLEMNDPSLSLCVSLLSEENLISKMVTLQEKEKTYFTFIVSQWNQTFFQVLLGRFIWSILHNASIYVFIDS